MDDSSKWLAVYRALHFVPRLLKAALPSAVFSYSKKQNFIYYDQSYWAEMVAVALREEIIYTSITDIEIDCYIEEVVIHDER
jgi:hypothetical protein